MVSERGLAGISAGRRFRAYLQGARVDPQRFRRGIRPTAHVGHSGSAPTKLRNSSASGQSAANASRTRLAVSLISTAIFNNRSRMVENSPLARGCGFGDGVAQRPHQPIGRGMEDQPHLFGER